MLSKYGNCTRLLKIKNKLKNKVWKNFRYFVGVFNKTIIPLALVGYEMIIANSYPTRARGIIVNYAKTMRALFATEFAKFKIVDKLFLPVTD